MQKLGGGAHAIMVAEVCPMRKAGDFSPASVAILGAGAHNVLPARVSRTMGGF